MTFFGYGSGNQYDSHLGDKINDLLAGRPSAKQKIEEFMVQELHLDPSKLPLSLSEAKRSLSTMLGNHGASEARLLGTTQGLGQVEFTLDSDDPQCTHCGYAYTTSLGKDRWECDSCGQDFTAGRTGGKEVLTSSHSDEWNEALRIYGALVKGVHDETGEVDYTKFAVTKAWSDAAEVVGVPDPAPKWKRPTKYPVGAILRVSNGTEQEYVRVGGPFSDTDLLNLATMKPMKDVSSWTVQEVLNDGKSAS